MADGGPKDEEAVVLVPLSEPEEPRSVVEIADAYTREATRRRPGVATYATFTATVFLSAALLFSVQPLFAKMVLPKLGGSPSVWAVALLFFQAALLAGYCYAHLLIRALPARATGFVHLALCALAIGFLPIALPADVGDPPPGDPYLWQLGVFATAVGLPFVVVAANAPLLQAWFAATGHREGRDPYFLYAASNLGSLLALLSYPLVLEPTLGLQALSMAWAGMFLVLVAALALCFLVLRRSPGPMAVARTSLEAGQIAPSVFEAPADEAARIAARRPPRTADRLAWIGLSFVPSALLTAVTTHISTDVASAPLIWVVPLSLYLLTFVIVFRDRAWIPSWVLLPAHLLAVGLALVVMAMHRHGWMLGAATGAAAFFTSALVAHRQLYEARPAPKYLTEFYLWMSFGGVLGGLFSALIAPQLFAEVFEYPLLLALSFACRPGALKPATERSDRLATAFLLVFGVVMFFWLPWAAAKLHLTFNDYGTTAALAALFGVLLVFNWRQPYRQLVCATLMFLAVTLLPSSVHRGAATRSYFGVYRVAQSEDGQFNVLTHGTTLHGAQRIRDNQGDPVVDVSPATYYYPASPMAQSVSIIRDGLKGRAAPLQVGVVGLGGGSLACLAGEGETWRFFEIDPTVVHIARNGGHFTYLSSCQPDAPVVLGDARLTLAEEKERSLDLLILDAFTSDAVPVHLMTAEALQLYFRKLRDDGVAVLHVSNRYLDLERVLTSTIGSIPGLVGVVVSDETADGSYDQISSTVVVVARTKQALAPFIDLPGASEMPVSTQRAWTDDYSDILGPLLSKRR